MIAWWCVFVMFAVVLFFSRPPNKRDLAGTTGAHRFENFNRDLAVTTGDRKIPF